MEQIGIYIFLFAVIVFVGFISEDRPVPTFLLLVVAGILLSLWSRFPIIFVSPHLILDIFLPILIYQISTFGSFKDFKKNYEPIIALSVGHVIFITVAVAFVIHTLLPSLGWPLAFVLGAIISPPDDVAIVSVAENAAIPKRLLTVLEGEALFNDATALILFRFSLAAFFTHEMNWSYAISTYFVVIIGETLYGLAVGFLMGEFRMKIKNPMLHMMASVLTPFIAYLPCVMLGGCGVLATLITGFVIGNFYAMKFTPEFRLFSRALWPTLSLAIQNFLFLLIGLNLRSILQGIASVSTYSILLYSLSVIFTVIVGRFIWVYAVIYYLPRLLGLYKRRGWTPLWQFPFVISWSGMRGGISMAAAFAVPSLPVLVEGANTRDLLLFLVFCVITVTLLIQGTTLPWIIRRTGLQSYSQHEKYKEHISELNAQLSLVKTGLRWLREYRKEIKDKRFLSEIDLRIKQYKMRKDRFKERLVEHDNDLEHNYADEVIEETSLMIQVIEVERTKLFELWRREKIPQNVRDKLMEQLDHRIKQLNV